MANQSISNLSVEHFLNGAEFEWNEYFITFTVLTLLLNTFTVVFGFGNIATIGFWQCKYKYVSGDTGAGGKENQRKHPYNKQK